jgi:hypothetical protein
VTQRVSAFTVDWNCRDLAAAATPVSATAAEAHCTRAIERGLYTRAGRKDALRDDNGATTIRLDGIDRLQEPKNVTLRGEPP